MKRDASRLGAAFITTAVFASGGCESSKSIPPPSPSTVEAKVTGKVTANGVPVSQGKVTVSPPGPPFVERVADIQKDGSYEVKTYVGKNAFSVAGTGIPTKAGTYDKKDFDVKEGTNTIDLPLPLTDK